jgi:hypothetical protein
MQIAFNAERYQEAYAWLRKFQPAAKRTDPNFILWVKSCEVCINIATSSPDLDNSVEALAKLVQRSAGISTERRKVWQQFVKVVKMLTNRLPAGPRDRRDALDRIEKEIASGGGIAQRDWLLKWIARQKRPLQREYVR